MALQEARQDNQDMERQVFRLVGHVFQKGVEMKEYHGLSNTRQYSIWHDMKNRCSNSKFIHYKNYGGRGIKVCRRWSESFVAFWEDMKDGYCEDLTIDRINNDGNYEPSNCKWSTPAEQSLNKRIYKNNRLGARGVQLRDYGKYRARIRIQGKLINLGQFDTIEKAIIARKKAEQVRV